MELTSGLFAEDDRQQRPHLSNREESHLNIDELSFGLGGAFSVKSNR